ncbi:MAG: flagellar hook-basal body complex protein FliE [Gammaproteobacteria bacterium]|nr:flagellar hook-basal body complex protein FliE [Gammaproteobacteria bacterium]
MNIDSSQMINLTQQMKALAERSQGLSLDAPNLQSSPVEAPGTNFGSYLKTQLDSVNSQQAAARKLATSFELGDPNVSLVDVMIQSQKSSISFRAAVEVRNKLLTAYQEIMNMPV